MADVTRIPGVWEQVRLVATLRWRILRNSLRKKNNQWDLIGTIIAGIFAGLAVMGVSVGFGFGAYTLMSGGHEAWIALPFWGIFLFWQLFPVFTAGFGAGFDFRNLLRFPLSLRAFYILGLAYGLADFAAIASICWLIATILGATMANAAILPAMLVISLLFVLMNITLERLIGSWLERILARRALAGDFFRTIHTLCRIRSIHQSDVAKIRALAQPWVGQVLPYLAIFPPSLAGRAILGAAQNHFGGTLLGSAGVTAYALLFSVFLWLRFATQYRGEELSETAAPSRRAFARLPAPPDQSDALRLLTPQVAAVLRKEFRYLTRNSFAFFLLIMPPVFVLLFTTEFAGRHPTAMKHPISTEFFFPGMMAYLILILMAPAYNSFAYDGKAIQTYFTSPLSFREVFLGKNLLQVANAGFRIDTFHSRFFLSGRASFVARSIGHAGCDRIQRRRAIVHRQLVFVVFPAQTEFRPNARAAPIWHGCVGFFWHADSFGRHQHAYSFYEPLDWRQSGFPRKYLHFLPLRRSPATRPRSIPWPRSRKKRKKL